jgi:hypothetical protein
MIHALVALAFAVGPAPEAVVGCAQRAESGRGPLPPPPAGHVVVGPLAFRSLTRVTLRETVPPPGEQFAVVKAGVLVEAGHVVTLAIAEPDRPYVRLQYSRNSAVAVRFEPCARTKRAFSYDGVIGARTGWAGAFLVTGRRCVQIRAWVDELPRPLRRTIGIGRTRCP